MMQKTQEEEEHKKKTAELKKQINALKQELSKCQLETQNY